MEKKSTSHNAKRVMKSNPLYPKRLKKMIDMRLQGMPLHAIGLAVGMTRQAAHKILSQPEAKEKIREAQSYYLQFSPYIAQEHIRHCLDRNNPIIQEKAIREYHKVTGISQAHTTVIDQRQQTVISPEVLNVIGSYWNSDDNMLDLGLDMQSIEKKGKKR